MDEKPKTQPQCKRAWEMRWGYRNSVPVADQAGRDVHAAIARWIEEGRHGEG